LSGNPTLGNATLQSSRTALDLWVVDPSYNSTTQVDIMQNPDHSTHDNIERALADIDWPGYQKGPFTPSPVVWEDQTLYFLLVDRFSNGREKSYLGNNGKRATGGTTPPFEPANDAYTADYEQWKNQGDRWQQGTLNGLSSKLGYLQRLGITAIWISPVFKQVAKDDHAYHGYAIQNFLDVDPHFGTRQDLKNLVKTAHALGIYVILDIVLNYAGNVFEYDVDRYASQDGHGNPVMDPRWDGSRYCVQGYRNGDGKPVLPFAPVDTTIHPDAWPDGAVWPAELQAAAFTRKGRVANWNHDPEHLEGDFLALKAINHGTHDRDIHGNRIVEQFHPSSALEALCGIYKFWMAFADLDGYRIGAVEHIEPGATRYFTAVIQEYAQSLGKENFYLLGEITGGRALAFELMETTGLSAVLGVDDMSDRLEYLAKGYRNPQDYFDLFRHSVLVGKGSQVWYGEHIVTLFDDHDQVRKGNHKARFCGDAQNRGYVHLRGALALNLTSMGVPCIYYGTEQAFDGAGDDDRFLRECMFGGHFGAQQSTNRHFFNEKHAIYRFVADVLALRKAHIALRRGRQYLRQISASGESGTFGYPHTIGGRMLSVVPWSRIFNGNELLLAINTDVDQPRTAWVTIDAALHTGHAKTLQCLYSTDLEKIESLVQIEARNGKAVQITVPAGGFVIYG
jgi:glycosidase